MKPSYENGSKSFIAPKVTNEQSGTVFYAKAKPESLVPRVFMKNRWGVREWEYYTDKTLTVLKYTNEKSSTEEANGKELTVEIEPMKHANKVREESYGAFWKKSMTYDDVNQTMAVLDAVFKTLVKTGKFVLKVRDFGEDVCVHYTGDVTEHLKLAAGGRLDYNFLGRYCSANVMTDVLDEIRRVCSLTSDELLKIKQIEHDFLTGENHVSATIARDAYHVFQGELSAFSGFYRPATIRRPAKGLFVLRCSTVE